MIVRVMSLSWIESDVRRQLEDLRRRCIVVGDGASMVAPHSGRLVLAPPLEGERLPIASARR